MASGVYQIKNQLNGKRYVGSTRNMRSRKAGHLSALARGAHPNAHLQAAFEKYGESAFTFAVLEKIEDLSQLVLREQHFLDTLNPEYNIAPIAGSSLGRPCSLETRTRMGDARRGMRNHMYGKHHTAETRAKISRALRGRRGTNYGKRFSDETRAKMRVAWTPERRQAQRARGFTSETRAKMSESAKARWYREKAVKG